MRKGGKIGGVLSGCMNVPSIHADKLEAIAKDIFDDEFVKLMNDNNKCSNAGSFIHAFCMEWNRKDISDNEMDMSFGGGETGFWSSFDTSEQIIEFLARSFRYAREEKTTLLLCLVGEDPLYRLVHLDKEEAQDGSITVRCCTQECRVDNFTEISFSEENNA